MDLFEVVARTIQLNGSDIFVVPGSPIVVKCMGKHVQLTAEKLMPSDTEIILREIYEMSTNRSLEDLFDSGDDDFSFSITGLGRFRCNAYRQRGSLAAVLRVVALGLPDPVALGIPESVMSLYAKKQGIVLVTGPGGSGKSTTLACLIDRINQERMGHIITIEDPIEFLHPHGRSIVSQREVRSDTSSFTEALHAALRQAPDVIMLGEMRDFETIQTAMIAAETGHLMLSCLHTIGAAKTIDRIIDIFPPNQQQQARVQLSMVLEAVVSQQLIPTLDGRIVPAFEVMHVTSAIRSMIRDSKTHQIDNVIFSGGDKGMLSMDGEILRLCREGVISRENALMFASNPETMLRKL
jgi:twitching motility protein PilT